jgi:hypothetical protein
METKSNKTTGSKDLKETRGSPPRRSTREILQQGGGSSGVPLRGLVETSETAVEISAKSRDELVVRNLPEVKPRTSLLGVSGSGTPLQGASISGILTVEELGYLVSGVGGLHLVKMALSRCARRKLKKAKARASEVGTGGIQQPGNAGVSKQGETLTETFKRPRVVPL